MKEKPILFSDAMVRAILDGSKTQTRRVVKNPSGIDLDVAEWVEPYCNAAGHNGAFSFKREMNKNHRLYGQRRACNSIALDTVRCPYGKRGDQLWVREAWNLFDVDGLPYPKGNGLPKQPEEGWEVLYQCEFPIRLQASRKWRPSIHMPRWASRIDLKITGVRVERLQNISEEDAKAEGANKCLWYLNGDEADDSKHIYLGDREGFRALKPLYKNGFANIWAAVNSPESWNENPWVWVVEFERKEVGS